MRGYELTLIRDTEVWKVIQNVNSKKQSPKEGLCIQGSSPTTPGRTGLLMRKERKARTLLLMAVPKDHLRRFHGMDDAKEIWAAIKTRKAWRKGMKGFKNYITLDALVLVSNDDLNNNLSVFEQTSKKTYIYFPGTENVAFLSQPKPSSSKHKPATAQKKKKLSSYTTSSSKQNQTFCFKLPMVLLMKLSNLLATNLMMWDLIHEDLDQIDDSVLE
ncbi:hypothetical protein Tco_0625555 [Tanacetum coccineum]|uniref:Xylulose kinase-1 n=1 Tax=Tanacetum coccineum TaxID=301880 RepID=A0ABQ4WH87_9ASTR